MSHLYMKNETKNLGIMAFLAVLVIGAVLISGCVQKLEEKNIAERLAMEKPEEKNITEQKPEEKNITERLAMEKPEEKNITEQQIETLREILDWREHIFSVKYDVVITKPEMPPITYKEWRKGNKTRIEMTEEGKTIVHIIDWDAKMIYQYMPAENVAMKIDFSKASNFSIENAIYEHIEKYMPTIVGREIIEGKTCIVIKYIVEGVKTKIWVWEEKRFPIRIEMTHEGITVRVDYKNIEFVDIPDSVFELPAGVQIIELPSGSGMHLFNNV